MRAYAAGQEEKSLAQKAELNQWEVYSRFADYAMVNCQTICFSYEDDLPMKPPFDYPRLGLFSD